LPEPEHYARNNGIAAETAPSVKPGKSFLYFDPIDQLSKQAQARWRDPIQQKAMLDAAMVNASK
jgi:lysine 2,3-aminomutase